MGLLFCAPAFGQSGDRAHDEPDGITGRVVRSVEELSDRAARAVSRFRAEAREIKPPMGVRMLAADTNTLTWEPLAEGARTPARIVLLVHGLDEPGSVWDELAAPVRELGAGVGFSVARFDYPNDQPLADSAPLLAAALENLRARGTERVDLICHSMGGLIARDVLTRPGMYAGAAGGHERFPDVGRLILVGTPNGGSPLAKLRAIGEIREQVARFFDDPKHDARGLLGYLNDGLGEAGDDLLPGSTYLTDLNARALPSGVAITVLVGRVAPVEDEDLRWLSESWLLRRLAGDEDAQRFTKAITDLSTQVGDGAVPAQSAQLPGVSDTVFLEAGHRTLVNGFDIVQDVRALAGRERKIAPGIPIILDRLAR